VTDLYRMHDAPDAPSKAAIVCDEDEARRFNTPEHGYGVFRTVNSFRGARRKDNLTRINAWCIDIDDGTKEQMVAKLNGSPLIPSGIVETKRGYQAYWSAADGAKVEHWNALVLERLVPFFGADKNARDLCRILRAPGYLHLKNPAEPFMCRTVHRQRVQYTERQLADAFPWVPDKAAQEATQRATREVKAAGGDSGEDFWQAVYELDCRDALERLSGTGAVNGESFTFRQMSNGNANIFCDGKGTSCWIDVNGKIGSMSKGGPTVYAWLRWYQTPPRECVAVLKNLYPHLADIDEAARKAWRAA
jgi:hypothetical protein